MLLEDLLLPNNESLLARGSMTNFGVCLSSGHHEGSLKFWRQAGLA